MSNEDTDIISQEEYDALSVEEQQEYEQIDEISRKTLGSYIKKATDDVDDRAYSVGVDHSVEKKDSFAKKADERAEKKIASRKAFMSKAVDRLTKEDVEEIEEVEEAVSAGAETLKANSRPAADPKSKIEVITAAIGAMHTMKKDDLVKWYNDTMAQFGKFGDGAPAASEKNKSTISAKPSAAGSKGADVKMPMVKITAKEDVEEMFGEELSEEFKERATTLFEAAVTARVTTELARLEEELESRLDEEVTEVVETLTTQLDNYLDYVVENWMKENEVAIESALRNELMEDFIEGLKGLFAQHYIDVPNTKLDVLESLASKVEELETRLNESIEENVEMKRQIIEVERGHALAEVAEGLTVVQMDKFEKLAEGIEFDGNLDSYRRKLNIIKENYFGEKPSAKRVQDFDNEASGILTEEVVTSPEVKRYVDAISRTIKK
jgi:AcrR family transcriptional regulator